MDRFLQLGTISAFSCILSLTLKLVQRCIRRHSRYLTLVFRLAGHTNDHVKRGTSDIRSNYHVAIFGQVVLLPTDLASE